MLAIQNKLKRLFHSYPKLSFVSQHFVVTLAPLRLSFSQYCIGYFPAISFVIFPHYVDYFSPTLRLSFSRHCILIFPPFHLSFFCHCVRLFRAILFVIFPPVRSSVVTLPLFPPLHLSSHSSPSRLYIDHFFDWLPLRLSFSCHYVLHFSPKGLS